MLYAYSSLLSAYRKPRTQLRRSRSGGYSFWLTPKTRQTRHTTGVKRTRSLPRPVCIQKLRYCTPLTSTTGSSLAPTKTHGLLDEDLACPFIIHGMLVVQLGSTSAGKIQSQFAPYFRFHQHCDDPLFNLQYKSLLVSRCSSRSPEPLQFVNEAKEANNLTRQDLHDYNISMPPKVVFITLLWTLRE